MYEVKAESTYPAGHSMFDMVSVVSIFLVCFVTIFFSVSRTGTFAPSKNGEEKLYRVFVLDR